MKQKKSEDSTILLTAPVTTPTTTTGSTITATGATTMTCQQRLPTTAEITAPLNTGTILSLQPSNTGGNRLAMENITLPVSSTVNCGGNIIICSGAPPTLQHPQTQPASLGTWNCQVSLFN